ncbi:MAG: GxxExxY protein [Planctomycetota bacterium]
MTGEYRGGQGNYGEGEGRGGYRGGPRGGGGGRGGEGGGREGGGGRERRGIPLSALDPALTAVSHKVIGAARDVHVALGSGFAESVYAEALKNELTAQGIPFKMAHTFPVKYKDQVVGQVIADFFIDGRFVLEVMAEPRDISGSDRSALRAQLKAADVDLGLIMNFAGRRLMDGLVRVLNVDKINAARGEDFHHDDEPEGGTPPGQTLDFDDRG